MKKLSTPAWVGLQGVGKDFAIRSPSDVEGCPPPEVRGRAFVLGGERNMMNDLTADFYDAMKEYDAAAREAEKATQSLTVGEITRQACEASATKLLDARMRLNKARLRLLGSEAVGRGEASRP